MQDPPDLRGRLVATLVIALGVAGLAHLPVALCAFLASIVLAMMMGVKMRAALHRLAHIEGFLIVLFLFLPFSVPGQPLATFGPLTVSGEGLARAGLVALKVNTLALVVLALLGGAAPEHLGRALLGLGLPAPLVRLIELLARHLHTAREGVRRQSEAMRARAFRPSSTLHSWRSYGHLIGGALARALDRAERVEAAMRLRGGCALAHAVLPPLDARNRAGIALATLAAALAFGLDRIA